jgi:hypothetical protein
MRSPRAAGVALALLASADAVCACGGASSASSGALYSESSVAAAAADPVTVSPLPGTPDASPSTQISFLGGAGTRVSHVRVVGSRSGPHAGVLRSYSTGTGASFLVTRPFQAGELVSVRARVGKGVPSRSARTTFTIAHQAAVSQSEFPISAGENRVWRPWDRGWRRES